MLGAGRLGGLTMSVPVFPGAERLTSLPPAEEKAFLGMFVLLFGGGCVVWCGVVWCGVVVWLSS